MPHNPSATPAVTPFGPVANTRGNVIRLHRPTTIERSYARQGRQFPDEQQRIERDLRQYDPYGQLGPIDLRVNQLKLRVHPPIPAWQVCFMFAVAAFIGVLLATGGVL
jgi:hypothetical protein